MLVTSAFSKLVIKQPMLNYPELEEVIGTAINDRELYQTAFTHRSYLNENRGYRLPSNERLEFLGDAILQFLSSEYLYAQYPDYPEGRLTNIRAAIVCTSSLAQESSRLGYGQHLLLSHGEDMTGGREREYILANTFEAVLGAIYLDNNVDTCREFLHKQLFPKIEQVVKNKEFKDAKSNFQELAQDKYGITPTYEVLEDWGPDHSKTFKVGVFLEDRQLGWGVGNSKQEAQQAAAQNALGGWA